VTNILTFDIEDWFHLLDHGPTQDETQWSAFNSRVERNTDRLLDLLADTKNRATFFCLGWVAANHPRLIRRIHDAGYEIGSHSYAHQLADRQTEAEFRDDLERVTKTLEDLTGTKVRAHRAPGFSFTARNPWVFRVMAELGIEYDSSIFPMRHSHGGFESTGVFGPTVIEVDGHEIRELPINFHEVCGRRVAFSGGGYFRLMPYAAIRYMAERSPYVMTYFHPRDFDASQPMVPGLGPFRTFRSYVGLVGAFDKLRRYLEDFAVTDIEAASRAIDWSARPRIRL
jgi:polysaccharide deacetylase family protein (PEP-CTERM system associated)